VLSAHQDGGVPLRPMPLEISRCLHVPGAELAPPPHLCNVGLAASWLSTLLGPMAKLATVVAGAVSCRLLIAGGAAEGASTSATLGTSLRPGLNASARLVPPVEGGDSPFFPSPWQASHCSRV
jgi:hypothetical protein